MAAELESEKKNVKRLFHDPKKISRGEKKEVLNLLSRGMLNKEIAKPFT